MTAPRSDVSFAAVRWAPHTQQRLHCTPRKGTASLCRQAEDYVTLITSLPGRLELDWRCDMSAP